MCEHILLSFSFFFFLLPMRSIIVSGKRTNPFWNGIRFVGSFIRSNYIKCGFHSLFVANQYHLHSFIECMSFPFFSVIFRCCCCCSFCSIQRKRELLFSSRHSRLCRSFFLSSISFIRSLYLCGGSWTVCNVRTDNIIDSNKSIWTTIRETRTRENP